MLCDLAEKLVDDPKENNALKEVSRAREQRREQAAKKLCESIDLDVLMRGTGSQEHQRELYKFLASCDILYEDINKPETVQIIQEFLAELLADKELGDGEAEFLAMAMHSAAQ